MDLESFGKKKKKKKRGGLELADEEAEKDAGEFQLNCIIQIQFNFWIQICFKTTVEVA